MGTEGGRPGSERPEGAKAGESGNRAMTLGMVIDRDGDGMLCFLSRLARFGLTAGAEPLLRPNRSA